MTLQDLNGASASQKLGFLQEKADQILKEAAYSRKLSDEELQERKNQYVDNDIQLTQIDQDFQNAKQKHAARAAPLIRQNKILLTEVTSGVEELIGTLYLMADHQKSMMYMYDANGELVGERFLEGDEKQGTLF